MNSNVVDQVSGIVNQIPVQDFLVWMKANVEQGVNFGKEQIPDIIHQLLTWKLCANIFVLIIGITTAGVMLYLSKLESRKEKEARAKCSWSGDGDGHELLKVLTLVVGIAMMFFFVLGYGLNILQILIAPKVYLLDYLRALITK